jgi:hypothetical protein
MQGGKTLQTQKSRATSASTRRCVRLRGGGLNYLGVIVKPPSEPKSPPTVFPRKTVNQSDELSDEDGLDPAEKPMGFFEHLEELRWTLVKCVIVYAVFPRRGGTISAAGASP